MPGGEKPYRQPGVLLDPWMALQEIKRGGIEKKRKIRYTVSTFCGKDKSLKNVHEEKKRQK